MTGWITAVQRRPKNNMKKAKRPRLYHLTPYALQEANRTHAICVPGFLSPNQVTNVRHVAKHVSLPCYTANAGEDIRDGQAVSTTTYLTTRHLFQKQLSWLHHKVKDLVTSVNENEGWGFATSSPHFQLRVAEWHEMSQGGSLSSYGHYDIGSLITVDLCLEEAHKGAHFQTVDARTNGASTLPFHSGDAIVFISHKRHRVTHLKLGHREVLVLEYWRGIARSCGHRCDQTQGVCDFQDEDNDVVGGS